MSSVGIGDKQTLTYPQLDKVRSSSAPSSSKLQDLFQANIPKPVELDANSNYKRTLDWLTNKHYSLIVELIQEKQLPLTLICCSSPLLIEQLVLLDITLSRYAPSLRIKIMDYAKKTAINACPNLELTEDHNTHPSVLLALEKLGKLTYLVEHKFSTLDTILNDDAQTIEKIYEEQTESIFKSLKQLRTIYETTRIQSACDAAAIRFPQFVAEQILTADGYINPGLLLAWIHQPHLPDTNFSHTIKERLEELLESPNARKKLNKIKIRQTETIAHKIVRISLSLSQEIQINDQHARICALTALLSQMRQSPSYSCFSLVICISQLASNIETVIEDFHQLLLYGKVQRKIGPLLTDFPFLLAMANKDIDKKLSTDTSSPIWENPGIKAACSEMNITDPESAIKQALTGKLTVSQLLYALATQQALSNKRQIFDLFRRGCFAFEAQTNNALLTAWSNAVAGMAEGKLSSVLKSELLRSIIFSLNVIYKGLEKDKTFLKDAFDKEILKQLIHRIHHHYDPFVFDPSGRTQNEKQYGGFVLYERNETNDPSTWIRLDNPELFKAFLSKLILESGEVVAGRENLPENKNLLQRMTKHLDYYIHTNAFLDRMLPHYMQQPFPFAPSEHLDEITQAPWVTIGGNDTETTLEVYLDETKQLKVQKIRAMDASSLLEQLVQFGRSIYLSHPKLFLPRTRTIARIAGLHAFNVTLGHPSLTELWKETNTIESIKQQLIENGKSIEKIKLSKTTKSKISSQICQKILKRKKIASKKFRKLLEKYDENQTIVTFSSNLRTTLSQIEEQELDLNRVKELDTIILTCLSKKLREKITKNCIHIADSNWSIGTQDLHFCFLYNPCSQKIELWKCGDKNKNFQALNQDIWVSGQNWELLYF